jgi:hypothetical protein
MQVEADAQRPGFLRLTIDRAAEARGSMVSALRIGRASKDVRGTYLLRAGRVKSENDIVRFVSVFVKKST